MQDTIKGKDKTISEQQREIKVYEEERSFIKRFFHSFYLLLNIRLMLHKMGFDDDTVVKMHHKQVAVRGTADVYSGMYKRNFTEENAELRITTNEKYCCPLNFKTTRFPYPQRPSIGVADSFFEK